MRRPLAFALIAALIIAVASAQVVDESRQKEAFARYRTGQDYLQSEQFDKAAEEFSAAVKIDPLLTLAHYGLGQAYMGSKSYSQAVQAFIGCRGAYRQIAALGLSNKVAADQRLDDEIRELRDSIRRIEGGQIKTSPLLVPKLEGRIRDLENSRHRGMEGTDTPAEVSLALGSAYFRSGALVDAEREYRAAIAVNPRFGEAHNNLAVVYMMTNRLKEAEDEVKQAEKAGYHVNPKLKEDLKNARKSL